MKKLLLVNLIFCLCCSVCWANRSTEILEKLERFDKQAIHDVEAAFNSPNAIKPPNPTEPKYQPQPKAEPVKTVEPIVKVVEKVMPQIAPKMDIKVAPKKANVPTKMVNFGNKQIPADYKHIGILGQAEIPVEQAVWFAKKNFTKARLSCSVEDIVKFYYAEAESEGVRPDLALCQAIVETGSFSFTGTVKPTQNNFCGLGTTGNGVKGARFDTPQEGVRAHVQHLLAYCKKDKPKSKIVDPRYDMVHKIRLSRGLISNWYGLNGTWAMGANYCEKIMAVYMEMVRG